MIGVIEDVLAHPKPYMLSQVVLALERGTTVIHPDIIMVTRTSREHAIEIYIYIYIYYRMSTFL